MKSCIATSESLDGVQSWAAPAVRQRSNGVWASQADREGRPWAGVKRCWGEAPEGLPLLF